MPRRADVAQTRISFHLRSARFGILVTLVGLSLMLSPVKAGATTILFESASPGPLAEFGSSVSRHQFVGVRFEVTSTVRTAEIGTQLSFISSGNGLVFGAIVGLTGSSDLPDSFDLSTPDVLGTALLGLLSPPSAEVSTSLAVTLTPGWYALVFGSGQFGATGFGAMSGSGSDIGSPSYFFGNTLSWSEGGFSNHRMFVTMVPEPAEALLLLCGSVGLGTRLRRS